MTVACLPWRKIDPSSVDALLGDIDDEGDGFDAQETLQLLRTVAGPPRHLGLLNPRSGSSYQ